MLTNIKYRIGRDISDYKDILRDLWNTNPNKCNLIDSHFIRYDIDENTILVFNIIKGKLAKFSYLNNYPDEIYEGIKLGMTIEEISKQYNLIYNEDENYFTIEGVENVALSFEKPYLESISEDPNNKIEEVTFFDQSLLSYDRGW